MIEVKEVVGHRVVPGKEAKTEYGVWDVNFSECPYIQNKPHRPSTVIVAILCLAIGFGAHWGYTEYQRASAPQTTQSAEEIHKALEKHNYGYCPYCGESLKVRQGDLDE